MGNVKGRWQLVEQMLSLRRMARYNIKKDGRVVREYLKEYYSSPHGSVEWQDKMVSKSRGSFFGYFFFLKNKNLMVRKKFNY